MIHALSNDELLAVLGRARGARERDWLMILVAYWHGLRASEVVAIMRDDIRDGYLTVRRLKGSEKTTQPLISHPEPLLNERDSLVEYASKQPSNQPVFKMCRENFFKLFRRHAAAAGIPAHKRHPHCLKHSIAMDIVHTAGVENTRIWLGHKNLGSTGEYAKPTEQDAAKAVISTLPGLKV